jgi:hypothetical protein
LRGDQFEQHQTANVNVLTDHRLAEVAAFGDNEAILGGGRVEYLSVRSAEMRACASPILSRNGSTGGMADGFIIMPAYFPGLQRLRRPRRVRAAAPRLYRKDYSGPILRDHLGSASAVAHDREPAV